jgi:hypothetical protein
LLASHRAAAADEMDDKHDQADHQKDVDEAAADMEGECSQEPQDEDDNRERQEHELFSTEEAPETTLVSVCSGWKD